MTEIEMIPKLNRIICGEVVIKEENTERGIEQFKIRVDEKALWLEHWIITNDGEEFIDGVECDWAWLWDRVGGDKLLPR